jgi:hypothetical protein
MIQSCNALNKFTVVCHFCLWLHWHELVCEIRFLLILWVWIISNLYIYFFLQFSSSANEKYLELLILFVNCRNRFSPVSLTCPTVVCFYKLISIRFSFEL